MSQPTELKGAADLNSAPASSSSPVPTPVSAPAPSTASSAGANAGTAVSTPTTVRPNDFNLIWVDMEMTGLDPDTDRIIEVAVVVTDSELNILGQGPVFAIHQPAEVMDKMDAWNKGTHGRSGLIERVRDSTVTEAEAEAALITFLRQFVGNGKSPMCGNTICQDRRFMVRTMPKLEAFFHYRNLDVSTLKELCKRWKPEIANGFKKHQKHTALADIVESIEELRYYREHFIQP